MGIFFRKLNCYENIFKVKFFGKIFVEKNVFRSMFCLETFLLGIGVCWEQLVLEGFFFFFFGKTVIQLYERHRMNKISLSGLDENEKRNGAR